MGASTAKGSSGGGGGSYGGGERDRNEQRNVVNKVKVKTAASKAKDKALASGNTMYGGAVSKGIDDALVKSGNVKVGSYFKKVATGKERISRHLTNMMGGTIAVITAVLVVNPPFEPEWIWWIFPTILITPIIFWWNYKILK